MIKKPKNPQLKVAEVSGSFSIETFKKFGLYERSGLIVENYSCWNGNVSVRKHRVTVELIDEPNEAIIERLQDLWDKCDNSHHWTPLQNEASKYGYSFPNSPGSKHVK